MKVWILFKIEAYNHNISNFLMTFDLMPCVKITPQGHVVYPLMSIILVVLTQEITGRGSGQTLYQTQNNYMYYYSHVMKCKDKQL